nr:retrovirus-related Pol polyprotein from transposon TNT 1-94 [Tanacetum cinerariifolium]
MLKHIFKGRFLASFQDREDEGGDKRSQDGIKDNDRKIKIQDHSMQKKFPRTRLQVSRKVHLNDHPLGEDVDNTKTKRPQPRSNIKNDRVPSTSKSSRSQNKEAEVEEHHMNLLLSKNNKHISSACNNIKIDSQDVISKVVCAMCKLVHSSESKSKSDCSNGDNACTSNILEPKIKRFPNSTSLLDRLFRFVYGTVRFGNNHVAAILGFGDLQWGNILITRVYFVEGLGHNLFSVGQFCDSDLEVVFRRDACFVKNLEGVDLLKGDHSTNLYTINLHEMASASPIYLMARASSTKSWLWHQRLSHLNFDTINDLARNDLVRNDLVAGLPKFKYHKEHLCPSCEQGKSKRASHPLKPDLNSRQRLHLLHMDLCGPMRIASINGKRYVLVIVDDYSRYTWVHFLISEDEAPENDREDIGKLGAKGDIGFFIGYSADSCAYRVYNQRTKKIIETMNVSFDVLFAMAFEQRSSKPGLNTMAFEHRSSKPGLQSMTSRQISSGLDLTYAPSTITTQQPTEGLPKFNYHKEHLCPSCEQGKSKRASHPLKPVPNSRQRLHLLHMDLCGPMRIASINGKRKPDISFLHVFGALCYPKNDREDIRKLGAKGDIGFFIGYSADSCAYIIYNRWTKKIMETMNVSFDELLAMAFEQSSSKPGLNSITSGHISSGLDLTYASSTITTQQLSEGDLDLLFEAMYDDYIGG